MAGPVEGLRVVSCASGPAGARFGGMLADYGADVVWIEPPGGAPWRDDAPAATSVFARGVRSIALDLAAPDQRCEALQLIDGADVFLETWRPGVAASLGLDWVDIHARVPGLVYCSISGFGVDGRYRDLPGYEAIVHALIGTMGEQVGHRDGPIYQGLPFAAIGAACLGLIGTLAALYRRSHDGVGRRVETSLFDGALAYLSCHWGETDATAAATAAGVETRDSAGKRLITRSFICSDHRYLGVHTGALGAFGRFMQVLGLDDRVPPSATGLDMGIRLEPGQMAIVEEEVPRIMATRPRSYWVEKLLEADVCAIEHLQPGEVFDQPQPLHNGIVVEVDDGVLGRVQQVGPPAKLTAKSLEASALRPAPRPGQHAEELRAELAAAGELPQSSPGRPPDRRPLLDGVRILDFGAYIAGPYSSRLLADLGAEVIKVEPVLGDQLRGLERCFHSAQAGKYSLAADLKDPQLQAATEKLLEWADIVHHNLRPGAAERIGLGYEHALRCRPDGIYVHAPGWGSDGPHMSRQSFAPMMSGYVGATFEVSGEFNPPMPPLAHEDPGNGLVGAVAMLLALLHRQRTGEGVLVQNPQLHAAMTHVAHIVRNRDATVIGAGRLDPLQMGHGPLERLYVTADGWVCLVAVTDKEIAAVGEVLGVEILGDARFASSGSRLERCYELSEVIAEAFNGRITAEVVSQLQRRGVAAVEPVGTNNHTFMNDPEARHLRRVAECVHPEKGRVREIDILLRFTDVDGRSHRLAPDLGMDTDRILGQLGYGAEQIAVLRARGAIA